MNKTGIHHHMLKAWVLIGICTALRLLYAHSFPLTPDETNYWQWSRYLAWGYHDQTPMIAWAMALTTSVFGHTEVGVRLPSVISMTIASIYMVKLAKHWFSSRTAWHTALLTQSVFIFNAGAVLATADGLQGAGWAAASYYVARGFQNNQWRHWILGGLWFGFGFLSKYTMILFLPCVFIFGLVHCRDRLAAFRPYVGCAMGLAMFIPVIAWNAANDWNSVRHVAYLGGANESFKLHFNYFAEFIGSQAGLMTPLVFGLICAAWVQVIRNRKQETGWLNSYLLFTSLPMIACFAVLSFHTRVYGNWPCAGYLTACVLAANLWSSPRRGKEGLRNDRTRPRRLWVVTIGSAYLLTGIVFLHVVFPILPIPPHADRTVYEIRGWDELGVQVAKVREGMPEPSETFLFGLRYQIASELAFYVPGQPRTVSINKWNRPNVYDYWWQDEDVLNKDAVGVMRNDNSRDTLLQVFQQVDAPIPFNIYPPRAGIHSKQPESPANTHYIYRCYGFKGGLRWVSPYQNDIRMAPSKRP